MRTLLTAAVLMIALVGCKQVQPPKCWQATSPTTPSLENPWKSNIRIRSGEIVNLQLTDKPSGFLFMEDGTGGIQVSRYSGIAEGNFQNVEPILPTVIETYGPNSSIVIGGRP